MKRAKQDLRIALAVYATALCAVAVALFSLSLWKGRLGSVGSESVSLARAFAPFALLGGSLAVPFGILALRDTRLRWTVPCVAIPTIVAAFVSVRIHPIYSGFMTLGVGYLAMGLVRRFAVRSSEGTIQVDGASRCGHRG